MNIILIMIIIELKRFSSVQVCDQIANEPYEYGPCNICAFKCSPHCIIWFFCWKVKHLHFKIGLL